MKKHIALLLIALLLVLSAGALANAQTTDEAEEIDTEDWLRIEGNGVALLLPLNFQGGDLEEVIELITENMDMLGEEFAAFQPILEANPDIFRFYAFDPDILPSGGFTNVNITAETLPRGMEIDLEDILDQMATIYPSSMDIVESDVIELGEYEEVGKIVIEAEFAGAEQALVQYFFVLEDAVYSVTFTTSLRRFEDYAPIFEASAATFEVIEEK